MKKKDVYLDSYKLTRTHTYTHQGFYMENIVWEDREEGENDVPTHRYTHYLYLSIGTQFRIVT